MQIKVGVLGSGKMGESVVQYLKKCPQGGSIMAYDIDENIIRKMKDEHHVAGTASLQDILSDPAVKLVFVTASNHAHRELAIKSLEAGKAVLCEKPIANTLAGAREMVETSERLKVFFQIGFELRYSLLYSKVKDWIDAGLLGKVVSTHCLYNSGVGVKL